MRNTWKIAVAFTLALGLGGVLAQAQPLIVGNASAFGCGPIYTSDFTLGTTTHSFIPDGAGGPGPDCTPTPSTDHPNGRGLAVGGTEVFYTELTGADGFGPTDFIHVAPFNSGAGGADGRVLVGGVTLLQNPRPGSGIQDLTFSKGTLYVLTGYDTQAPIVYGLNLLTGAVIRGPVTIALPDCDFPCRRFGVDGLAVLPNGNFLINRSDASCIYNEYDSSDGHLIGSDFNVPGGPAECTGVDTDGGSLFFLTDFNSITRTNFTGGQTGFNFFNGGDQLLIEDISVVHPVTTVTEVGDGHVWLGLRTSADQGTNHDLKVELLLNGTLVPGAEAVTRCIVGLTRNPTFARDVIALFPAFPDETLVSGDVVSFRFWTRIGTNDDDTKCRRTGDGGGHNNGQGIKLYYDSVGRASHIPVTLAPDLETPYYLHSDGGGCPGGSSDGSAGVTDRFLDKITPTSATAKCAASGSIDFNGGNLYSLIGTWNMAAQP